MRLIVTAIVWVMASVVVAGAIITLALSAPELGIAENNIIGWVTGAGFVVAIPLSYWIAGRMLEAVHPKAS